MKTFKKCTVFIAFLFLSTTLFAQEITGDLTQIIKRKNSIDLTVGGTGLGISANYNRIIAVKTTYFTNISIGVGKLPAVQGTTLSQQITWNYGKKNDFFEIGMGGMLWLNYTSGGCASKGGNPYFLTPMMGWRRNFKNNMVFRLYLNPLIDLSEQEMFGRGTAVMPYGGLSLGYSF